MTNEQLWQHAQQFIHQQEVTYDEWWAPEDHMNANVLESFFQYLRENGVRIPTNELHCNSDDTTK
jgi:hypothetical protein